MLGGRDGHGVDATSVQDNLGGAAPLGPGNFAPDSTAAVSSPSAKVITTASAVFEMRETVESWDRDYYNHPVAERYYDAAIPAMLRLMDSPTGAMILDAGCGPRVHSIRAARAGYRVHAVDISRTMLDEAEKRIRSVGLSNAIKLSQQDLTNPSFADGIRLYLFLGRYHTHPQYRESVG